LFNVKQHGRKSAEALSVIRGGISDLERPEPPADLTEAEAVIWRETIRDEPVKFFATAATQDMLRAYCQHRGVAQRLTASLNEFEPEWLKDAEGLARYNMLLRMREREVVAAVRLATKLRLTNQSRYESPVAAKVTENALKGQRPWET
jgi:hypothetical protein